MRNGEAFFLGLITGIITIVGATALTYKTPDYKIIPPHYPEGAPLHSPDGTAAPKVYQYDPEEWEVVITVDDHLVLRHRKAP